MSTKTLNVAMAVQHGNKWAAIPQRLADIDLNDPLQASNPDISYFPTETQARSYIDSIATTRTAEYLGWLPIYKLFGNCGHHPQFRHLNAPPEGWSFSRSAPLFRLKPDKFAAETLDDLLLRITSADAGNPVRKEFEEALAMPECVVERNWRHTGYDITRVQKTYVAELNDRKAPDKASWPPRIESVSLSSVVDQVADVTGFKGHFQRPFEAVLVFDGLLGSDFNVVWANGLFFVAKRQDGVFHYENYCETDTPIDVKSKLHLARFLLRSLPTLASVTIRALLNGSSLSAIIRFLRSRSVRSQIMVSNKHEIVFLPSVPYYFGQVPWVVELEDFISLCFPFIHNGKTAQAQLSDMPEFPVIKAMLQMSNCKGIITHVKSTAENLPKVFGAPCLAKKMFHVPMGVALPEGQSQLNTERKEVNLLFTSSWHQSNVGFFVRGGMDVLLAFQRLARKYDNVNLIWRSPIPPGPPETLLNQLTDETGRIRIYRSFVAKDEYEKIFCESDIYVLPSARIHVVSILEAMSYGMATVVSDGWGIQDYVSDGHNGVVIPGRWGVVSWDDPKTGMFHENYAPMYQPDEKIISGLVDNISGLIENPDERRRLGANARRDVAEKFNFENWNAGFRRVLNTAIGIKG